MNTAEPNAADATTTEDYDSRRRGQRCSLSQRKRAGVRENAANRWRLATRRALPLHELERRRPALRPRCRFGDSQREVAAL